MKRIVTLVITVVLLVIMVLEAGVLYKMISAVINQESPRQVAENGPVEPLDLTGEWMQKNTPEDVQRQVIRITADTIEVYWVPEGGEGYALYWAGTYEAPANAREPYRWKSVNDRERTGESESGETDKTKKFTYKDGLLTYKSGGTEVEAERREWGYEDKVQNGPAAPTNNRYMESGDIGEYHIEIGGASLSEDITGAPAVIVTYSWTNNSPAAASAMVMLIERAYQGGEQLTSAQVDAGAAYDAESASRTVEPGETQLVQRAFLLTDAEASLTFEVSEFLSHTKDAVVKEYDVPSLN
ncbi:MAG: DUF5067 domain-containing protein [Oscillospiraceae bacterium]|nr:DUF5067 domain-containing protein [Oscillospiraceae bacterium]